MDARSNVQVELIPEISSALSINFKANTDMAYIIGKLKEIGLCDFKIITPQSVPVICLDIAVTNYIKSWELDEVITKMFLKITNQLLTIKDITKQFGGDSYIDVSIYHYGTIPAIIICKDNINKINYLNANISIDIHETRQNIGDKGMVCVNPLKK